MENTPIVKYYGDDHHRLDALFGRFRTLKLTARDEASKSLAEFRAGLLQHIRWEEDILFPLFEERTGIRGNGPTAVMRAEHALIKEYLEQLFRKISIQDTTTTDEEESLVKTLHLHNLKEESVLYPSLDRLLDPAALAEVYAAMEKKPL
jgi:regulator of cell morphogenesis and NO signaling